MRVLYNEYPCRDCSSSRPSTTTWVVSIFSSFSDHVIEDTNSPPDRCTECREGKGVKKMRLLGLLMLSPLPSELAHIRQSGPESGPGFQVKKLRNFKWFSILSAAVLD